VALAEIEWHGSWTIAECFLTPTLDTRRRSYLPRLDQLAVHVIMMANAATTLSEGTFADHNEVRLALIATHILPTHSSLAIRFYTSKPLGYMLRANPKWMLTRRQSLHRYLSLKVVVSTVPT